MVLAQRRRRPRHGQPDRRRTPRWARSWRASSMRRRSLVNTLDGAERQRARRHHLERPDDRRRHTSPTACTRSRSRRRTPPATPGRSSGRAGQRSSPGLRSVLASSRSLFFPQDLDSLDEVDQAQLHAAAADDRQLDGAQCGRPGRSSPGSTRSLLPAGTLLLDRSTAAPPDGTMLPRGRYTSCRDRHRRRRSSRPRRSRSTTDAFTIKLSDTTPGRGQSITITITSAEPSPGPRACTSTSPASRAWSVEHEQGLGTYTYKATLRLKSSGRHRNGLVQGQRASTSRADRSRRRGCSRSTDRAAAARRPHQTAPHRPVPFRTGTIVR